jgi:hypothetical protein
MRDITIERVLLGHRAAVVVYDCRRSAPAARR